MEAAQSRRPKADDFLEEVTGGPERPEPAGRLVVVVFGGFEMVAAAGPAAVFGALRRQTAPGAVSVSFAASRRGPLLDASQILVHPDAVLTAQLRPGVLLFPSGPGVSDVLEDTRLLERLRVVASHSRVLAGVGNGVLALAKVAPLNGWRVTTAPYAEERLRGIAPEVEIDLGARIVHSGRVWTCQSVGAAQELALKIIERTYSAPAAQSVAQELGMAA